MFYIGVVEDNKDPKKLGRLKVRIFGLHTFNRNDTSDTSEYLSTFELPWAYPIFPISNSCTDGISDFSNIVCGTKVIITFMDKFQQQPFYLGVLPYILENNVNFNYGFTDLNGEYPKNLNESSISRLARNENINNTYVAQRNANRVKSFTINDVEYDEPPSSYNAEYPYNRVIETEGGIVIELDSTPNNERINIWHPSGDYTEISNDGTKVSRINGLNIEITNNDKVIAVDGTYSLKIGDGANIELTGSSNISTSNSQSTMNIDLKGDLILNVEGENGLGLESSKKVNIIAPEVNISANNTKITATGKNPIVTLEENGTINATKALTVTAGNNTTITSQGSTTVTSQGNVDITSTGKVTVSGSVIELN